MEDPTKTVMDELGRTSGVVGVERLAALFIKREPDAAKTMSRTEVRRMANEVLRVKPDKQILAYRRSAAEGPFTPLLPTRSGRLIWQTCELSTRRKLATLQRICSCASTFFLVSRAPCR